MNLCSTIAAGRTQKCLLTYITSANWIPSIFRQTHRKREREWEKRFQNWFAMVSCWHLLLLVFLFEFVEHFITELFVIGIELNKKPIRKPALQYAQCAHTSKCYKYIGMLKNRPFMSQVTSFFSIFNSSNLIQIKRKLCKWKWPFVGLIHWRLCAFQSLKKYRKIKCTVTT